MEKAVAATTAFAGNMVGIPCAEIPQFQDSMSCASCQAFRIPAEKGKWQMDNAVQRKEVAYYIFRASRTVNGVTYYAKDYGLKAFKIPVYR